MKNVKITVQGPPGAGKTTIAQLIADALAGAGITVSNQDIDVDLDCAYPHLQPTRVAALADGGMTVTIVTQQSR